MPITSTDPGGSVPFGYRLQRLTLSSLVIGEVISGEFTEAALPGADFSYTIASTDITTATAALKAAIEDHVSDEIAGGSAWVEVTVGTASTFIDVTSLDADGDLFFSSTPGGSPVVTKLFTGNSVARAQVTTLTPLNVLTGDSFTVTINSKPITVTATADTAANVASLLADAINASLLPEWREVLATVSGDVVTLTARVAGRPFTVTAGSSDAVGLEITTTVGGVAGTNAVQAFSVPKSAAGTFDVTVGDQLASGIAVGASAATVQTAITGLSTVGAGNAAVGKADSADGNDDVYTVTFQGTLAKTPVAQLIVELTSTKPLIRTIQQGGHSGTVQNEKQTIEVGVAGSVGETFTLTLDGQTTIGIASPTTVDASISGAIAGALINLAGVRAASVVKDGSSQLYTVEFTDYDGSASQSQMTASVYSGAASKLHRLSIVNTAGTLSVNEVQKVAVQGSASGGTFTLTYSGQTTAAIAHNATTGTVQTALENLSNIGVGDVAVTGVPGAWIVTFQGALAGQNVSQMTATSSLTGTAAANVTVATTTTSAGPNHWDTPDNWLPVGVPVTGDAVRFEFGSTDVLYGLDQTGVTLASLWVGMGYSGSIGLPRINAEGYPEYRVRDLTLGVTDLRIGDGEEGSGPRKVAVNTGTVVTAITVVNSGDSVEANVPCVIWKGDNVANQITVDGGDFGCSWWADESSRFSTITQRGGTVFLRNATIVDKVQATNQDFRAWLCTLGTKPLNV